MPKISESFGGKWLTATDVGPRGLNGIIDEVTEQEIGQGEDKKNKLIVWIKGQDKGLVLNLTNANDLASAHGDDTDEWVGKKIALKIERVSYQGRSVNGIRINLDSIKKSNDHQPSRKPAPPVTQEEADEEIPF